MIAVAPSAMAAGNHEGEELFDQFMIEQRGAAAVNNRWGSRARWPEAERDGAPAIALDARQSGARVQRNFVSFAERVGIGGLRRR